MSKKKLLTVITALSISVFMLSGCENKNAQADTATKNPSIQQTPANEETNPTEETAPKETEESNQENKDITDVVADKERIVVSSVAAVEILDALNVPMVGVPTSSYTLPDSVADAQQIGNPMSPDLEIISSLEPTVIVSVDSLSDELQSQFETLGAESVFVNLSSYDGLKDSITNLGERFNVSESASQIITEMEQKESTIQEKIADKEKPSVLIIFGANTNFMVASEDTYVGDLVKRVGGVNIIENAPSAFSPVDMEYLADKNPDYILFMAHANPEESLEAFQKEFETNQAWNNFDAVTNNKVYALETGYFGMSANLLAPDAMERLVDILYGEN